jgi:heterodisulfide reductase subunit B
MADDYKLFSGCVIQNRAPHLEASAKAVFDKLGLKYSAGEFGCCPIPVGMNWLNEPTSLALAARNICVAESEGKNIMSLCNGCFQSLALADIKLKHDPILKKEVNEALAKVGKEYKGTAEIQHFVSVLSKEVGIDKIKAAVTKPLTGLKVALHPGCHFMRPSKDLKTDDPLKPQLLRKLVEATGATVVDYEQEIICCGNTVRNTDANIANNMLKTKIDGAMAAGADCLCVNCPACYQQFDGEQGKLKALAAPGQEYKFPTFYITELLALAMGKTPDEIGMAFHMNKGKEALAKIGFAKEA